jgi:Na+-transporting NADH:ubiquinone oxidoreductase subunit NqrD
MMAYVWNRCITPMAISSSVMILCSIMAITSKIDPLRVMGISTAVTVFISFFAVMMLMPPILVFYE